MLRGVTGLGAENNLYLERPGQVAVGYTDNAGAEQANVELGMKRAEAAKQYLVTRHGIDPGRISAGSKGAAEPAYDNATADGRAKNRRAQIVVTLVSGT